MNKRSFYFFRWTKPYITNKILVEGILDDIDNSLFRNNAGEEDVMLLSLLGPTGLLRRIYQDREKRKDARKRLKNLPYEGVVGEVAKETIKAIRAARAAATAGI